MAERPEACFHCGEPCDDPEAFAVQWQGATRPMCCAGCRAVFQLIHAAGLERFYRFREGGGIRATESPEALAAAWRQLDDRDRFQGTPSAGGRRELLIQVEGVHCAACAWLIRSRLEPLDGVDRVSVDVASGFAEIAYDPERVRPSRFALELARIGYRPHLPLRGEEARGRLEERRGALRRLGVAGLGMMQVMMFAVGLYAGEALGIGHTARRFLEWTSLLVTVPVVFYAARPFFRSAIDALRARRLSMDVPVALAIAVAFTTSCVNFLRGSGAVYFDSVVMFVFFLSIARYVQLAQRHRNAQAGAALARLMPEWADRLEGDGVRRVPAMDLAPGDRIRVRAGAAFPADGVIESGETRVDESLLTGESEAIWKRVGDAVVSGSLNRGTAVTVSVSRAGDASTVSVLGRLLLRPRDRHAGRLASADRLAGIFVAMVLAVAAAAGVYWSIQSPSRALPSVLAVLVVSCPCALALATPAALAAASRRLLPLGVLVARGAAIETLSRVDTVVFDKTGTLTRGEPELESVALNPDRTDVDESFVRRIAAALEVDSTHPLARAFMGDGGLPEVMSPDVHAGLGISGRVDGRYYRLGTAALAGADGGDDEAVWLGDDHGWLARFTIADAPRADAEATIDHFRSSGFDIVILSGDAEAAVSRLARRFGVNDWSSRQAPGDKIAHLRRLRESGRTVLMVGDGINDAPVLAAADVSMAVRGSAGLAQGVSDMALTGTGLGGAYRAYETALATRRIIRQNLAWALLYNVLAIPLAFAGVLQPWMAALGMSASSLVVVGNAARLARGSAPVNGVAQPPRTVMTGT